MMTFRWSLTVWATCVVIVLALVVAVAGYTGGIERVRVVGAFAVGFLFGMFAMYLAVRIRRKRIEAGLWS
jgi:hypothetical protein